MTGGQAFLGFAIFCGVLVLSGVVGLMVGKVLRFGSDCDELLPPPSRDCRRSPVVGEARSGYQRIPDDEELPAFLRRQAD